MSEVLQKIIKKGNESIRLCESLKTEDNYISGCTASLWLVRINGILTADSDSVIVRGIANSVIERVNLMKPSAIGNLSSLDFEFSEHISISRRSGLSKLIDRIKELSIECN